MDGFWFLLFSQGEVLTGSTGFRDTQPVVLTPGREQEPENGRTEPSSSTRALSYVSLSWLWNHMLSQSSTCTLLCHRKEIRAAFLITSFFKICCMYSGGLYCLDGNYTLIYALFGLLLNYRRRQTMQGIPSQKNQLCGTRKPCASSLVSTPKAGQTRIVTTFYRDKSLIISNVRILKCAIFRIHRSSEASR